MKCTRTEYFLVTALNDEIQNHQCFLKGDDGNHETVTKDAESLEGGNPKDRAPTLSATYSSSGN
ncbi:hypothetical protein A2U01_0044424 [Trifolium medium]|uniref:Uncharacterized protein n=1 Tax=Trifolium medium TaxID=97028 RepID=A0A392QI73_9FABA|nr:hypothetical protein [Trifolium medium]